VSGSEGPRELPCGSVLFVVADEVLHITTRAVAAVFYRAHVNLG
jgi:hypothetical protein